MMVTLDTQNIYPIQTVRYLGADLSFLQLGEESNIDIPQVIWGHGWMQSHLALLPLAQSLETIGSHLLIDFPGFGNSPLPPKAWGTREYAEHTATWLNTFSYNKRIWIGHSFGCRVGIQLAACYPELIDGLVLIAAPGLPTRRSVWNQLIVKTKIYTYKGLKRLVPYGINEHWLIDRFGSRDYRSAGMLRPVLIKVISENLTGVAKKVQCPVHLVYGDQDTETPYYIGQRYAELMQDATFSLLPRIDHYTILTEGRHQVLQQIKRFLENSIL